MNRTEVINALHEVYKVYGTTAALDLAHRLEEEPPPSGGEE